MGNAGKPYLLFHNTFSLCLCNGIPSKVCLNFGSIKWKMTSQENFYSFFLLIDDVHTQTGLIIFLINDCLLQLLHLQTTLKKYCKEKFSDHLYYIEIIHRVLIASFSIQNNSTYHVKKEFKIFMMIAYDISKKFLQSHCLVRNYEINSCQK